MHLPLFDQPLSTGIQPRDYQADALDAVERSWEREPGALVRMATGLGKTVVGSLLAQRWLERGDDYRVLVVSHEQQLIWQFAEEIGDILGDEPEIEMGQRQATGRALVTVASRRTIYRITHPGVVCPKCLGLGGGESECDRCKDKGIAKPSLEDILDDPNSKSRLFKFDRHLNWLLLIDEAHRWSYGLRECAPILQWFESNPNSRRVGLTATPERSDGSTLEKMFPFVACDYRYYAPSGPCALNDGWLVPYDQRFVSVEGVDFNNLKEVAGDFTDEELGECLEQRETLASLINPTLEIVGNRSTLIFSPTVAVAKAVADQIKGDLGWGAAESLEGSVLIETRKDVYKRL